MEFLPAGGVLALHAVARPAPGEVHVWPLQLEADEAVRTACADMLEDSERERAGRYYFEKHRHHFILARGQMRHLLGRYCGVEGAAIRFALAAAGKPVLAPDPPLAGVAFNLTHSAGRALLAVAAEGIDLGVDIECHDRRTNVLALADRYFAAEESAQISGAVESQRVAAFFRLWTAKEAVIKAHGDGLAMPLDAFSVAATIEGEAFVPVRVLDPTRLQGQWVVRRLPLESGWSGAVAARESAEVRWMALF